MDAYVSYWLTQKLLYVHPLFSPWFCTVLSSLLQEMFGKAQCTSKGHFLYFCGLICLVCTICFPFYQMVQILQHRSAVFFRSLSFVTCMGCMSFVLLGLMYFVVDIKEWWGGQPFIYPGMRIHLFKGIVCPKIKYLLKMDLPSVHPNCV